MPTTDDFLQMLAEKLGVKSSPSRQAYKPSSYLDGVQKLEQGKNITPIHNWADVVQGKAPDPLTQPLTAPIQPPAPYDIQRSSGQAQVADYQKPDPMERGEDIIQLLRDAETKAGVQSHVTGHGTPQGQTMFQTEHLGKRDLSEDDALEYIKLLSGE